MALLLAVIIIKSLATLARDLIIIITGDVVVAVTAQGCQQITQALMKW